MKARTITILGMGITGAERKHNILEYCKGEVWGLNNTYGFYQALWGKWDRLFEIHPYEYLKAWKPGHDGCHFEQLDIQDCPVWVTETLPKIKKQFILPTLEMFLHFETNFAYGSPSYMLALALFEHDQGRKIEEIRSWGIDTADPQHFQQRCSWAYWMGRAMDRGIKVEGTSTGFMSERDNDEGLGGYREIIGRQMLDTKKEK